MPCTRFKIKSIPTSTKFPAPSRKDSENCSIMGRTCSMNSGIPSTNPSPSRLTKSIPALRRLSPLSENASMTYSIMDSAASPRSGARSLKISGIFWRATGARFFTTVPIPERVRPTAGTILSSAVSAESVKLVINAPKSALGSAIPATRLSHADFIAPKDPCIVSAASRDVVPVIPISSWTTCIASTISEYDEMSYSMPDISCALSSRSCMPSLVPAKPSARLSSIVKLPRLNPR